MRTCIHAYVHMRCIHAYLLTVEKGGGVVVARARACSLAGDRECVHAFTDAYRVVWCMGMGRAGYVVWCMGMGMGMGSAAGM